MAESMLRGIIEFMADIGVYDVVLPFLLIFTVVFAILEKSRIFGTEKVDGEEFSKKNINAMVAFVIAFFVVASSQLVSILNKALGRIIILGMVGLSFLLLIGIFFKDHDEFFDKSNMWYRTGFMVAFLIGVILIFLASIETTNGDTWLEESWTWITDHWDDNLVGSIFLLGIIVAFMVYITKDRKIPAKKKDGG